MQENASTIFDTGYGVVPGTHTFSFTYNIGDTVQIWFDKNGGGVATFQLVTFNIV